MQEALNLANSSLASLRVLFITGEVLESLLRHSILNKKLRIS
jgi:hypothetical protein